MANKKVKNTRDYWKQVYSISDHHRLDQSGRKRKLPGTAQDNRQAKRQQTTNSIAVEPVDGVGGDGPLVATANHDNIATQKYLFDMHQGGEQMEQLEREVDSGDPKVANDLRQLNEAVLSFGKNKCKGKDGKWALAGFGTHLYHHQVIGVRWMLGREMHPEGPNGGILADEMGLGKTVQLLACMSQNLPSRNSSVNQTLIVAPKRILCQWYEEIETHCSNRSMERVFIYSSTKVMTDKEWKKNDIM